MRGFKRLFLLSVMLFILSMLAPGNVIKVEAEETTSVAYEQSLEDSQYLRADVIERKYRYYYGRLQYRHWNRTRGKWVEDHWIDLT